MATYVSRVELHGVHHDHPIYSTLHRLMAEAGFVRFLTGNDDKNYLLPAATYALHDVRISIEQAELKAATAAHKTNYKYWTLTLNAESWSSHHLDELM